MVCGHARHHPVGGGARLQLVAISRSVEVAEVVALDVSFAQHSGSLQSKRYKSFSPATCSRKFDS
jgi:hypothetical protein